MNHCIICNSTELKDYQRTGNQYQLTQCNNCRYIFDPNPPEVPEHIYSKDYYVSKEPSVKGGYSNYFEESVINKLTFQYRLNKIKQKVKSEKAKLLDIGCATGDFLEVAKKLSWDNSFGVDVSKFAVDECLKKGLNAHTINDLAKDKHLSKNSFDVITMQDVIEHYEHPEQEIKKVYDLLKPGGILFLTTPNTGSISLTLLGKHWYHFKPGEHLAYFTSKNIQTFLNNNNFTNVSAKATPSWVTFQYLVERMHFYFPQLSSKFMVKLTNKPFFQIAFPLHTGEMEIWAQKPTPHEKN